MSRNDEESLLLSTNEAPEELKIESENRRTTVSVVTVLLSLIVTVATVSLVTMSGSGQPPIITENSLAADQTQLWSFPTFDSIIDGILPMSAANTTILPNTTIAPDGGDNTTVVGEDSGEEGADGEYVEDRDEVDTTPPPANAGEGSHVYKEDVEDYGNVCMQNDVPLSAIREGVVINPGCVVLSDKDLTAADANPQYDSASLVTICATREAGDVVLDSGCLSDMGLIFEGDSIVSVIGLGDDTQTAVFKDEDADGDVKKAFLGTPAKDGKYDLLYSLASNKYEADGSIIGGNVYSVEMKTSMETLSDCAATIEGSTVEKKAASKKHYKLFTKKQIFVVIYSSFSLYG